MKEKTEIKKTVGDYFARQKDVECVYLFGSTVSGKTHKTSDVDIAVLFRQDMPQEKYGERSELATDELSRISDKEIDIVVLNNANCFLKFQIIKNGLRIYERKDRMGRAFEARAIVEYFDFFPIRKRLEEAFVGHIKEGA